MVQRRIKDRNFKSTSASEMRILNLAYFLFTHMHALLWLVKCNKIILWIEVQSNWTLSNSAEPSPIHSHAFWNSCTSGPFKFCLLQVTFLWDAWVKTEKCNTNQCCITPAFLSSQHRSFISPCCASPWKALLPSWFKKWTSAHPTIPFLGSFQRNSFTFWLT